jgi:hypothetical protein
VEVARDADEHALARRVAERAAGAVFERPRHVRGGEARVRGAGEVARVGGDHEQLGRRDGEQSGSAEIDLGIGLEAAREHLRREHAVPRQVRAPGHVDEQRDVAVRERRDRKAALQPRQRGDRVGPRIEPVPDAVERVALVLVEHGEAEARQQVVEDRPVQPVDGRGRDLAAPHALHRRLVAGAPGVGERRPVDVDALRCRERGAVADDPGAPVDDGAEHVEDECAHARRGGGGRSGSAHGVGGPAGRALSGGCGAMSASG